MINADAIERELKYQLLRLECSWTVEHSHNGKTETVLTGRIESITAYRDGVTTVVMSDGVLRLHEVRVTAIVSHTAVIDGNVTRLRVCVELQGHESYTFVEGQRVR